MRYSLATYLKREYSYHDILKRVKSEATVNKANYTPFFAGIVDSLHSLAKQHFDLRRYNSDFGDLVPLIAASSFQMRFVICSRVNQRIADCSIIRPFALPAANVNRLPYVILHLANSHYSCTEFQHVSFPTLYSSSCSNCALFHGSSILTDSCSPKDVRVADAVNAATRSKSPFNASSHAPMLMPPSLSACVNDYPPLATPGLNVTGHEDVYKPWYFLSPKTFSVVYLNIQGLCSQAAHLASRICYASSKIDYLRFSCTTDAAPAIIWLTETNLSDKISNEEIGLPGYGVICRGRNRKGGGVAIYWRSSSARHPA